MEINRNNYEAYMLDLLEGRLTPRQEEELRAFLRNHPDSPVMDLVPGDGKLEPAEVKYPSRELLKKEIPLDPLLIDEADFEFLSIARMEGELNGELLAQHDALMREDPGKMREWSLWKKTRLVAQPVSYPRKQQLKRGAGILRHFVPARWIVAVSAAAAVILLFLLFRPGAMWVEPGMEKSAQDLSMETRETGGTGDTGGSDATAMSAGSGESAETGGSDATARSAGSGVSAETGGSDATARSAGSGVSAETAQPAGTGSSRETVTLSIKKQQDPPELTGTPARLRVAALASQPAPVLPEGTYDRIRPLEIPPSKVHTSGLSLARLSEMDMEEVFSSIAGEDELSLWSIAYSGIEGINRLAGTEMYLFAHRDEDGEISGIEFKSRIFSFIRPLDREE